MGSATGNGFCWASSTMEVGESGAHGKCTVTRGNKVNPATIAIGQQQLDRPFVAKFVRSHLGGVQKMQYLKNAWSSL